MTPEQRREKRIEIAADRISRELWDMMGDLEKIGGNGITAGLGLIGSTAAALVDRSADKDVAWKYLERVIQAAKQIGKELREKIDAGQVKPPPVQH
jgi:L-serine deaminase